MKKTIFSILVSCVCVMSFCVTLSYSATYYIAPFGDDITGSGTSASPWKTVNKGIGEMSSGETLVLKDGTYTGADNMIAGANIPPSGSAGNYTTVMAENAGEVVLDGEDARAVVDITGRDYIVLDGIVFKGANDDVVQIKGTDNSNRSTHIKIIRCGICDAHHTDNTTRSNDSVYLRYLSYVLVEDTYIWGNGRYRFYVLDSDHVILRRCLDRYDRGISVSGGNNLGSYHFYGSDDCIMQNCISIDAGPDEYLRRADPGEAEPKAVWFHDNDSTANTCTNNNVSGSIFLNLGPFKSGFMEDGAYSHSGNTVNNSVFWDTMTGFWNRDINDKFIITNSLFGNISNPDDTHDDGVESDVSGMVEVYNSIIYNAADDGLRNVTSDYNCLYGIGDDNYQDCSAGVHDISLENGNEADPSDGTPGNGTTALKYLCRIEDGSDLDGAGSVGSDIGPTIIYKIGTSGTLYGETGYNTITSESLWPWPNESIIRQHMKSYSYDAGNLSGDRGFCADGQALTKYIWEYLGNTMPADIYGSAEDTIPPYPSNHAPSKGAIDVPMGSNIVVHLSDSGDGVDLASIIMTVEGEEVTPIITGTSSDYTLTYNPSSDFSYSQVVDVTVDAQDNALNTMSQEVYSFTIEASTEEAVVEAGVYYVRPSGGNYGAEDGSNYDNAWDGYGNIDWIVLSSNLPCTLYVCGTQTTQLEVLAGGTGEDTRLTVRGDYASDPAVLDGGDPDTTIYGIYVRTYDYVTIDGFNIEDFGRGIGFRENADYGIIQNCIVNSCVRWGIYAATVNNMIIQNNICSNSQEEHGMYLANDSNDCVIRGNKCFGNNWCGIHVNGDNFSLDRVLIEKNILFNNIKTQLNCADVHNGIIRNNLLYAAHTKALALYSDWGVGSGSENNLIINNTFHVLASTDRECLLVKGYSTGNTILNNIFYTDQNYCVIVEADSTPGTVIDYNQYYNNYGGEIEWSGMGYSLSGFQSSVSQEASGGEGDPLFVSVGSDFKLHETSDAIDSGTNTNAPTEDIDGDSRPQGLGYDKGAYEYASGMAPSDTTAPYISGHNPAKNAVGVLCNTNIMFHIQDTGAGVDASSIILTVEGQQVVPVITGAPSDYTVTYDPPSDFNYSQIVDVTVSASDLAGVPNVMVLESYSFTVKDAPVPQDTAAPYTSGQSPAHDDIGVPKDADIIVHLLDDGTGVDLSSIIMTVEGKQVIPVITGTPSDYTLTYDPPGDFRNAQMVDVTIEACDLAPAPNVMIRANYSFYVIGKKDILPPYLKNKARSTVSTPDIYSDRIELDIADDGEGVDKESIKLYVEGVLVDPDIFGESSNYRVVYVPREFFTPAALNCRVIASDMSERVNEMDESLTVNVTAINPDYVDEGDMLVMGSKEGRGTVSMKNGSGAEIYFRGREQGTYNCRIFTLTGDLVWDSEKDGVMEDVFKWHNADINTGTYIVHISGPGFKKTIKTVVVN